MIWIVEILIVLLLLVVGIAGGLADCQAFSVAIDVNRFNSVYYAFGIHNRRHIYNEQEIAELTIGLVFINIVIEFYKYKEAK